MNTATNNKENLQPNTKRLKTSSPCDIDDLKDDLNWSISDFQMGNSLGKGKFGQVYRARQKSTRAHVALKVMSKTAINNNTLKTLLRREVEIQCRLSHPNILKLFGYFHDISNVYLILEEASGGEIYQRLKSQPDCRFAERDACMYIEQVAAALSYLHKRHVIHRDIKPENLLLSKNYQQVKLSDFGWAIHAPPPDHHRRRTLCGTPEYVAPEMLIEKEYDHRVDIWALGVLAYELIVGRTPFQLKEKGGDFPEDPHAKKKLIQKAIFQKVKDYRINDGQLHLFSCYKKSGNSSSIHPSVSSEFKKFVLYAMTPDPKDRPRLSSLKHHPWFLNM